MQIRLDPENAAAVKREALAHRRLFKRRRSYADVVNQAVRERYAPACSGANTVTGTEAVVQNARAVFGWDKPK